jgi:hypothetical protein
MEIIQISTDKKDLFFNFNGDLYRIQYCKQCKCFMISCLNEVCWGSSCNGGGCDDCVPAYTAFDKQIGNILSQLVYES